MSTIPVGTIIATVAPITNELWLPCNGTSWSSNTYANLSTVLTADPNNAGHFLTPNLGGFVLMGQGPDATGSGRNYTANGVYGQTSDSVTLTIEQMPSHNHAGYGANHNDWPMGYIGWPNYTQCNGNEGGGGMYGTTATGGGQPFSVNVLQPSYAVYYYIYAGDTP